MARRKIRTSDKHEFFCFTIDDWRRDYRFGINRHPWEYSLGHYDESDTIIVVGTLRTRSKRKFDRGALHLLASEVPRNKWGDEATRIGNVWVRDGCLNASAWIASDTFHSLSPALAAGRFKQMCNHGEQSAL